MKLGVIGIGDIAQKAYLPVITRIQDIQIIACSRNTDVLKDLVKKYDSIKTVTTIPDLIEHGITACFVHASTHAHYAICKQLLLNGIHVYVDKPVSYQLHESQELFTLAKSKNLLFRVGFNRRQAPLIKELTTLQAPDIVLYQKNRVNQPAAIRDFIYDDFIHVVDSIRFLMQEDYTSMSITSKIVDGDLHSVTLHLVGERSTAIGIMHRDSGKSEEKVEFICSGEKRTIENLNVLHQFKDNDYKIHTFNDWEPILARRGFHQIIAQFISDVQDHHCFLDKDMDALKTHELCELIVLDLLKSISS